MKFILAVFMSGAISPPSRAAPSGDERLWSALTDLNRRTTIHEQVSILTKITTGVATAGLLKAGFDIATSSPARVAPFTSKLMLSTGLFLGLALMKISARPMKESTSGWPNRLAMRTYDTEDLVFRRMTKFWSKSVIDQYELCLRNSELRDFVVALEDWFLSLPTSAPPPLLDGASVRVN